MSKWYKITLTEAQTPELFCLINFKATGRIKSSYNRPSMNSDSYITIKFKNKQDALRFKLESNFNNYK